jgi:uncharacterized protein (DUF885 family)
MLRTLIACLLATLSLLAAAAEPPKNARLHAFFDRVFQEGLKENPVSATFLGVEGMNDRLPDASPQATARRKAQAKAWHAELQRFDAKALNTQDRISRDMMLDGLRLEVAENDLYGDLPFGADQIDHWLLLSPLQGIQDLFVWIAQATPTRKARDYEDYLKRLAAAPVLLDQATARLRVAMKAGWMPPRAVMTTVPSQIEAFAKGDPAQSPLFLPFKEFPEGVAEAERARLREAGMRAIAEVVQPAFAKLKAFAENEYIPACRRDLAAEGLPGGKAYYALYIERSTTTRRSADEIHRTGLAEVARIRGEMDKVIASTGFTGSFADFLVFLRSDARFYYTKPEDLLSGYRDIAKRADAELPKLFAELPRLPYGVRAMGAHEGDNPEHYSGGALDGSRAGFFEANLNNLSRRPKYEMESLLMHEAVPGHHLQIARARELTGLPNFRRAGGYVAYSEGWALYAESLGYEIGMYKDPYSHFGALSAEIFRACRLVIDTGIHSQGWTRERAIEYLASNTGMHEGTAAAEVDRYIVWPGQALGYKVGELKIKELRKRASDALGERFDLRRFHNAILDDGALPLSLLETRIDTWIAAEKTKNAASRAEPRGAAVR